MAASVCHSISPFFRDPRPLQQTCPKLGWNLTGPFSIIIRNSIKLDGLFSKQQMYILHNVFLPQDTSHFSTRTVLGIWFNIFFADGISSRRVEWHPTPTIGNSASTLLPFGIYQNHFKKRALILSFAYITESKNTQGFWFLYIWHSIKKYWTKVFIHLTSISVLANFCNLHSPMRFLFPIFPQVSHWPHGPHST